MEDSELLRYSRQIMLPDIDVAGQEQLLQAKVLIVGLGGLGSPAAMYLAAAGVGNLILCDDDQVDLSNLQRQIAHSTGSIGMNKAQSAAQRIAELNPSTNVAVIDQRLDEITLTQTITEVTLVLDCTDNFSSRYLINDVCWQAKVPVVSGAGIRWEGQVTVFDPNANDSPCYRCLYPTAEDEALNCSENGVVSPLVGVIGACQALEAMKHITGIGESLSGSILYFDAKYMDWRKLNLSPRPGCPTCGG